MLSVKNISYAYGDNEVLQNLNLEVKPACIHGILGMNGAGKTTFFNVMYGLLKKQVGEMKYDGQALHSRSIAYLETNNYFYSYMRAREYLQLCAGKNSSFDIDHWNALFQLPLDYLIDSFSTGMKKKLAFMGVLALNRPVLILDEPFNGVDLESNEIIYQILLRLKQQSKLILLSSHIIETLTNVCDAVSYLNEGSFRQTFQKPDFPEMERKLRDKLQEKTGEILDQLMNSGHS